MDLYNYIEDVDNFPTKGVTFKDITPLLASPEARGEAVRLLHEEAGKIPVDKVAVVESRGFLFGSLLADRLGVGLVLIRKSGKLPKNTLAKAYDLEYGSSELEIHKDAIEVGDKVLIHDDLLATGGTTLASCHLVEQLGGEVVQLSYLIELGFLEGRDRLKEYNLVTLMKY